MKPFQFDSLSLESDWWLARLEYFTTNPGAPERITRIGVLLRAYPRTSKRSLSLLPEGHALR